MEFIVASSLSLNCHSLPPLSPSLLLRNILETTTLSYGEHCAPPAWFAPHPQSFKFPRGIRAEPRVFPYGGILRVTCKNHGRTDLISLAQDLEANPVCGCLICLHQYSPPPHSLYFCHCFVDNLPPEANGRYSLSMADRMGAGGETAGGGHN